MYNLKADVYTFSILMWEVLALQKPYAFARSMAALVDHIGKFTSIAGVLPKLTVSWIYFFVMHYACTGLSISEVSDGGRPDIKEEWPYSVKDILKMGFEASSDDRPPMDFILESIRQELCHMRDGDDAQLRTSYLLRRRSMTSMRNLNGVKKPSKARQIRSNLAASITKIGRQLSL